MILKISIKRFLIHLRSAKKDKNRSDFMPCKINVYSTIQLGSNEKDRFVTVFI